MKDNRRSFLKKTASLAAVMSVAGLNSCSDSKSLKDTASSTKDVEWPVVLDPNGPKLCVGISRDADSAQMRKI
ncbi:MAG: twin-arginine translocation signal domain-containing protein, partial [Bacteroidota bacterium]|nr:twin-arginine translocation signal domain-containing protein [Bacteroidota bacterium]